MNPGTRFTLLARPAHNRGWSDAGGAGQRRARQLRHEGVQGASVTDTIGWGEVDERPSRLPRVRLNRRRRIALTVVAALIAGGIVAWPSFRSWRADAAARAVQHIWAREQGYDNARVVTLAGVQRKLGVFDKAPFARAVVAIENEEAADYDRLIQQAKSMRTWAPDVTAARDAVVTAMVAQAKALRAQASKPDAIDTDLLVTTALDNASATTADAAGTKVSVMERRHHLKPSVPTTERYGSATAILAVLNRPTDEPLHLRVVTAGADGITVTDLDTGRVVVRRQIDTPDPLAWQAERLLGQSIVANVNGDTLIVPLTPTGSEHLVHDANVMSTTGSPMWVLSLNTPTLRAVDEGGLPVGGPVPLPQEIASAGAGSGSALLFTDGASEFDGSLGPSKYYLFRPREGRTVQLPTSGCPNLPSFDGGLIAIPTGNLCGYPDKVQIFDPSGRRLRTADVPGGEVADSVPSCAPDGRHIAVVTSNAQTDPDDPHSQLRILDPRTGSWTTIAGSQNWLPLNWSRDGSTLLVQSLETGLVTNQRVGQLGYWRVGDSRLHSIRVQADDSNFLL
jgi:hypothetical protein